MTDACADVLCEITAGDSPQLQNLDKDFNMCFLPPRLIWQCDIINDKLTVKFVKNHDEEHDDRCLHKFAL